MSYLNHIEIERIKVKYYDPANPMSRLVFKDPNVCIRFDFAIVDNNADPDKKGRIKVRFPHWGNVITNWIPIVRPYASKEAGIWMLPDVGTRFNTATPITTEAKTQQSKKQPKFQNPWWNSDKAAVGEEVTLSVDLVDQYDYANVIFKIWEDGADREKDIPVAVLKG